MELKKRQLVNHTLKNLPLLCLTAYTKPIAEIVDLYADIILVGDSLGTVLYGFESTREVTLDLMINHAKAVCRSTSKANIIVDMPYGTYENSKIKAQSEIFKMNEIDNFITFLNTYSSNSTIVLATSSDIGKPGPLIDKLIYEKSNTLLCPLVIINGNLQNKEIEKII